MRRLLVAFALVLIPAVSHAQVPIAGIGYRVVPQTAAPASFAVGACAGGGPCVGFWVPSIGSNTNLPQYRTSNGADVPFSIPGTYLLANSGPQDVVEDVTRLGVVFDMNGSIPSPITGGQSGASPLNTNGFAVIDSSGGGGFGQPFYVYFGVAGNGEIIGKQTLLDSQTFYFRSDMASIFTAHKASANTTGAEFLWYAGDGGAGAGGGGIHIVGGVPGAGAPTSGNGMELDSGPNADGQSIKDHGDQQCNLAADAALEIG